ncbi:hypothetical protein U8335_20405 [Roseiconus lacunae]|uniref:hypothetical protein n=1 Tax=Roseiconus lacunae TaxID=2605694 RepID=UPI001E42A2E5|nr:hypothetical protein [Roseiconus lacunae]MCD0462530.1 hypothetical protein [Roseiconus lacunae]WRQ49309.1 hypothetical protein U8335_20405 [Stieleria sp. HD01]
MNGKSHKDCFGKMFPQRIETGLNQAKVFSVEKKLPGGLIHRKEAVRTDVEQWDDCRRCPEFDSCYKLSMAKIALQTSLSHQ